MNPSTTYSANGKQLRLPAWFDFKDGYALVPMSKKDRNGLVKAQIIDKNGKEILSGGPYTYHTYGMDIDSVNMWSAQWGGTGLNYTIPLKKGTNVLKVMVDGKDSGATINMELIN